MDIITQTGNVGRIYNSQSLLWYKLGGAAIPVVVRPFITNRMAAGLLYHYFIHRRYSTQFAKQSHMVLREIFRKVRLLSSLSYNASCAS